MRFWLRKLKLTRLHDSAAWSENIVKINKIDALSGIIPSFHGSKSGIIPQIRTISWHGGDETVKVFDALKQVAVYFVYRLFHGHPVLPVRIASAP